MNKTPNEYHNILIGVLFVFVFVPFMLISSLTLLGIIGEFRVSFYFGALLLSVLLCVSLIVSANLRQEVR